MSNCNDEKRKLIPQMKRMIREAYIDKHFTREVRLDRGKRPETTDFDVRHLVFGKTEVFLFGEYDRSFGPVSLSYEDILKLADKGYIMRSCVRDVWHIYSLKKTKKQPMKTIYISGKIAGCNPTDVLMKFDFAKDALCRMNVNYRVINPVSITNIPNGGWQDYIERDLIYLKHCDTIYMLKDWKDSPGARVEHEFAKKLGLEIIYEEGCGE